MEEVENFTTCHEFLLVGKLENLFSVFRFPSHIFIFFCDRNIILFMLNHNDHLTQRKRSLECQNQAGYTPFSTELKVRQNSDKKWWTNCEYEKFTHTARLFHKPRNSKKYQTGVKRENREKLLPIWTIINEDLVNSIIYWKFCFFH